MSDDTTLRPPTAKVPLFSISRVWTISTSTVTQLVRMKTFYFLLAFALLIVAIGNVNFGTTPAQSLMAIKKISFGTMDLFAWLFAIAATALLIPRDLEDRTLYTILSKPVRRIEYLFGKLFGVLIVIGVSLIGMFIICSLVILSQQGGYIADEMAAMKQGQVSGDEVSRQIALLKSQGWRPELGWAVVATFFKAGVVAAVTICISTFASSSLFTIIVSVLLFLIGHAHTMATNFWLKETNSSVFVQIVAKLAKILIPDYQLFSFSEGIVLGEAVNPALISQMGVLSAGYIIVFLLLSLLLFVDKEF